MERTLTKYVARCEPGAVVRHRRTFRLGRIDTILPKKQVLAQFNGNGTTEQVSISDLLLPRDSIEAVNWRKMFDLCQKVKARKSRGRTSKAGPGEHRISEPLELNRQGDTLSPGPAALSETYPCTFCGKPVTHVTGKGWVHPDGKPYATYMRDGKEYRDHIATPDRNGR